MNDELSARTWRLLLVEDDEDDYILTRQLLDDAAPARFDLSWATTYGAALDRLEHERVDAVLVDYHLGADNGLELVRELEARGYQAPMILLTGQGSYDVDLEAMRAGVADYLVKGQVNGQLLERVIRYAIERKRSEAALREANLQLAAALAELRRTQEQVVQQERLRALGEMASGIAHDFNNALALIVAFAELLQLPETRADPAQVEKLASAIQTASLDAATVIGRLRHFGRPDAPDGSIEEIDLREIAAEVIALTQPRWKDQTLARGVVINVRPELGEVPPIAGVAAELREALTNLVFNAIDALPDGGAIVVRTFPVEDDAAIEIADTGIGMSDEVRRRCLEPFFTTKEQRGTGLGLAMVYGIVQRHRGQLEVASAPGQGTTIRLRLPRATAADLSTPPVVAAPLGRSLQILVVDDEPGLADILGRLLVSDGHRVELARNGDEALAKLDAGRFDVVITDQAMPGMNGTQLAAAVKRRAPDLPVIMATGFGELMRTDVPEPDVVDLVLSKPVRLDDLRGALARVWELKQRRP